jgi:hypothetical protein
MKEEILKYKDEKQRQEEVERRLSSSKTFVKIKSFSLAVLIRFFSHT